MMVGLIGLGIMGSAMGRNLIAAGFDVIGYDVAPTAMQTFASLGGRAAVSVSEVAAQSQIVITSLPSTVALTQVVDALTTAPGQTRVVAELRKVLKRLHGSVAIACKRRRKMAMALEDQNARP